MRKYKSIVKISPVNRQLRIINKTLLPKDKRVESHSHSNSTLLFLSLCIQCLGDFLRDALPFFLILRPRISFQCGIAQVCRLP